MVTMLTYRMEIKTTVCFDVEALNNEEAIQKAREKLREFEGHDIVGPDGNPTLYLEDNTTPKILDISDMDEWQKLADEKEHSVN